MGSLRQQIDFSYTEPRFAGRDLRAGYDIGYYRFDYTDTVRVQHRLDLRQGAAGAFR